MLNRTTVFSGNLQSGQVGWPHLASGSVLSGHVASEQIGQFHIASGAVTSGRLGAAGVPTGTQFLRDDFSWAAAGGGLASGNVGSGFVASGTVQGFFGVTRHIASGTVGVFDLGSGAVVAGSVGSGAVVSGNVASGQIGQFHVASGAVTSGRLGVTTAPDGTKFLRDDFTWQAVAAASITSGSVDSSAFASGAAVRKVAPLVSGLNFVTVVTEEIVSGVRAVQLSQSGNLRVAMASVSGRMPAVGVVIDNVLSGIQATAYDFGLFQLASGMADWSGYIGQQLFVGRSGQIVSASGSFNSGGLLSGDVSQPVGVAVNSGAAVFGVAAALPFVASLIYSGNIASGNVGWPHLASGAVGSGDVASGAVLGQAGGGAFTIASGTVGSFDIGSGAIVSGRVASGQIGNAHHGSGSVLSGHIASGAVWGLVGAGPHIASGSFTGFELGSGSVVSGRMASGQVGNFHVASGQIQGLAGAGVPNVASGSLTGFELGSGSVVSGRIASGQVGNLAISSGAVTSGRLGVNAASLPDGTKFLRDDFSWQTAGGAGLTSGSVLTVHFGSGVPVRYTAPVVSGLGIFRPVTEENISGVRAVHLSQSGQLRIAMASLSGRRPAIGVVLDNVASGIEANVFSLGLFKLTSGQGDFSGFIGLPLLLGRSGELTTSGSLLSGDVYQQVGVSCTSGDILVEVWNANVSGGPLGSGVAGSGSVASGAVQGFFGTTRQIASGTVGVTDFGSGAVVAGTVGSGAVVSGNIASGQVGQAHLGSGSVLSGHVASGNVWGLVGSLPHIASGSFTGFELGSGAVVSGRIASGQVGNFHIASGQVHGQAGGDAFNIASGSIGTFDIGSGAIQSGRVASGQLGAFHMASSYLGSGFWVQSGAVWGRAGPNQFMIASGTVATFDIASGGVVSGNIASGQVGQFHLASGSVASGAIASGQLGQFHRASGLVGNYDAPIVSGLGIFTPVTEENISGVRAVHLSQSGQLRIAMASLSGRRPAVGVVKDNVASGIQAVVYTMGLFKLTSGMGDFSGFIGLPLLLGRSGELTTSGPLLSGDIHQQLGIAWTSGDVLVQVGNPLASGGPGLGSGAVTSGTMGAAVVSGVPLSGSVTGQAAGGFFVIASGTVATFDIGSGAIQSGRIASGQIGSFHVGSGMFTGFELGSGSIVSGRIASGQVGDGHFASGQIQGLATKFSVGSGTFTGFELGSGSVVSGRIASGQVGDSHLASGQVQGLVTKFSVGSGTFGGFELGSGSVVSGRIASGQVGNFHVSSGAITSGRLGVNAATAPDGTKFLRDDFSWQAVTATIGSGSAGQSAPASGFAADYVAPAVSGYTQLALVTEEAISGVRAVNVSQSGNLRVAMASVSGRMPAVGVAFDNVVSGIQVNVYTVGVFQTTSGLFDTSGYFGQYAYVGRSGQLVTTSGGFNSGGFLSGDVFQRVGVVLSSGGSSGGAVMLSLADALQEGVVLSGNVGSGAITGQGGGGSFNIASGNVGSYDLASGCASWYAMKVSIYQSGSFFTAITSEAISGLKAVCADKTASGAIRIAMAAVSGRWPAIGVVDDNVASGIRVQVLNNGSVFVRSGAMASGYWPGRRLWLGKSGELTFNSGSYSSAGIASGTIGQIMGTILAQASGGTSGLWAINVELFTWSGGPEGPASLIGLGGTFT